MEGIEHKMVSVNGLNMHIAQKGEGPLVLFLHGFPELWYTWRHQITFMASHGYRAVAPDLRGYGDTTGAPNDPTKFTTMQIVADIVALLDAIAPDQKKVFLVGHDIGAYISWNFALFRPDRIKAMLILSVQYSPWSPLGSYVDFIRATYGNDHYIVRFQESGDIEAEFAALGTKTTMGKFLSYDTTDPLLFPKGQGFGDNNAPVVLPSWLSEQDFDYYTTKYQPVGFTGGLNYYRAMHLTWELTAAWSGSPVIVPTKFVIGDLDLQYYTPGVKEYVHDGGMKKDVPLLDEVIILEGAGHFINEERPHEINNIIYDFIQKF